MTNPKLWWAELPKEVRTFFQFVEPPRKCYVATEELTNQAWFHLFNRTPTSPLKRLCGLPNCGNPFHCSERTLSSKKVQTEQKPSINPDHVEIVEYVMDLHNPKTYDNLRKHLPPEDLDDKFLIPILNESYPYLLP